MESLISRTETGQARPPKLRAFLEIVNGQLLITPIADSDQEAAQILAAVRFAAKDFAKQ